MTTRKFVLPKTSKIFQVSQKLRMHNCALKPTLLDDAVENISIYGSEKYNICRFKVVSTF